MKEKVGFWVENAEYDLQTAEAMNNSSRYAYTAFMCQQSIEKILKGIYLQDNNKEAPRSHNLSYLIGLLNYSFQENTIALLAELSTYYLEGRYPTYKEKMAQLINKDKSAEILKQTKEVFK
ncbi:MAG: HEPN domain-containing protein [Candidatus Margulisbacteria bacterium]|nr:HEPN domain-containing protein [Candidatus Margulisiibacteriota bacterium]